MAHIAAVVSPVKNAGAGTHAHGDASDGDDGFAQILSALTPKAAIEDARPKAVHSRPVDLKQDEPAQTIDKIAPKVVRHVSPAVRKADPKDPVPLKARVPDKSDRVLPGPAAEEDDDASAVIPVRAALQTQTQMPMRLRMQPQMQMQAQTQPQMQTPMQVQTRARALPQPVPAAAPRLSRPEIDLAQPPRSVPEAGPRADLPARMVPPPPAAAAAVSQDVIEKIVAQAQTPPTAVDPAMLATADAARPTPRPAEKAPNKTDAGTQAVLAKADVVVIDEAPAAPAPAGKDPPRPKDEAPTQASAEPSMAETRATPQEQRPDPQAAQPPEPRTLVPTTAPATSAAPNVATHVEMPQTREIATALAQPVPSPKLQPAPAPNIAALASAIAARSGQGAKTFEIRLDPAELGRVEVHLHVSRDGKAEATLYAERPETVVLLQRDSHNLERALKDAGLDVSNSSLNFSLKGEQRQGDGGGASGAHTRSLPDAVVARSEAVNASLASQIIPSDDGRLDIRV